MKRRLKEDVACPICGKNVVSVFRVPGPGIVLAHYLHDGEVGRPRSLHVAWYATTEAQKIVESETEETRILTLEEA